MFRDDWLRWGFGPDLSDSIDLSSSFTLDMSGACLDEQRRPCIEIAIEDAQHIYETMAGPISLMVSGGVDSQAMAFAFKKANVPFTAYYARYPDGLNDIELDTFSFYKEHNIPVEIVDVDILAFHDNELFQWASLYQNNSPHFLSHMKIASLLPGTPVSAGCIVRPHGMGMVGWSGFGLERYSRISGQSMIGYFFNYDARLVGESYVLDCSRNNDSDHLRASYDYKVRSYQKGGFPIHAQVRKLHGFEKLKERFDAVEVSTSARFRYKDKASARPYDLLFRYPLEDMVPMCRLETMRWPFQK